MRLPLIAATLSLLPGLALADPSPISSEIAATGIHATEAQLAALPAPTPCPPHYESTHIAPSLWDIGDLAALKHVSEEIFGPVLQLARFSAAQ